MKFISKHASAGAIVRVFSLLLATMCILMPAGTRAQGSSAPERKGTVIVTDRSGVRVLAGDSAGSTTESALFGYPAPTGGTLNSTNLISPIIPLSEIVEPSQSAGPCMIVKVRPSGSLPVYA